MGRSLRRFLRRPPADQARTQALTALRIELQGRLREGRMIRSWPDGRDFWERSGTWLAEVTELLERVGASDAAYLFGLGGHGIVEQVPEGGLRDGIDRRCTILEGLIHDIEEYGSSTAELPTSAEYPRLGPAWLHTVTLPTTDERQQLESPR